MNVGQYCYRKREGGVENQGKRVNESVCVCVCVGMWVDDRWEMSNKYICMCSNDCSATADVLHMQVIYVGSFYTFLLLLLLFFVFFFFHSYLFHRFVCVSFTFLIIPIKLYIFTYVSCCIGQVSFPFEYLTSMKGKKERRRDKK